MYIIFCDISGATYGTITSCYSLSRQAQASLSSDISSICWLSPLLLSTYQKYFFGV